MVSKNLIIRPLSKEDYDAWRALWQDYITFYEASVPDAITQATWTDKPVCYLEDLYISPDQRRKGIGRALMDTLISRGEEKGWSRVYWHTASDNKTARLLYGRYKPADDMVRYRIFLND